MKRIQVKYSCPLCGLVDRETSVPARPSEDMDVKDWMEQTIRLIALDHEIKSSNCHPEELHNLKIPVDPNANWIGGVPS